VILVIDNYDSFTWNLVQFLGELGGDPTVIRNDERTVEEINELRPERIVLSPGPCTPAEEVQAIRHREFPIWGVQFHPESLFSEGGMALLRNFLAL